MPLKSHEIASAGLVSTGELLGWGRCYTGLAGALLHLAEMRPLRWK